MARILIVDFDGPHVTLLTATVGRTGSHIDGIHSWDGDNLLLHGAQLAERLVSFNIAPAPLVIAIGRDRLVLKEIKHPAVPSHEEPAVVRFQALKEVTDAGDDVIIDYQPRGDSGSERHALVFAIKRELFKQCQAFAVAANVKLLAVVPRALGIIAEVRSAQLSPLAGTTIATIVLGKHFGEFVVSRDDQLLFNRMIPAPALASDTALLGEVRRNLAVYSGQSAQPPVTAVYLADSGSAATAMTRLAESLHIPVHGLNAISGLGETTTPAGETIGAAGLARLLQTGAAPINFIKPREPKPPVDPRRRPILLGAGVFALLLIMLGIIAYAQIAAKDRVITSLIAERSNLDTQLASLEGDKRRAKAIDEWLATDVNWLDELYDLTSRFPDISKLRLVKLTADPVPVTGKSKYAGRVQIEGLATADAAPLEQLSRELVAEGAYRVEPKAQSTNTLGVDRRTFPLKWSLRFDVERRAPDKFSRTLNAEPPKRNRNSSFNMFDLLGGP